MRAGIENIFGTLTLTNCTLYDNGAGLSGFCCGGISNSGTGSCGFGTLTAVTSRIRAAHEIP